MANRGRAVDVFQTGNSYRTGHADQDPLELIGVTEGLGIRSNLLVPLDVNDERRGVLGVSSAETEWFTESDLRFAQAVAHWIGMVLHRAELVEHITRDAMEQARRLAADELITILAHDLGNYLTPLIGRIHILRTRAQLDGRTADEHDAAAMSDALERLRRLTADLLDAARLEQGIFALMQQPVDLLALTHDTADALQNETVDIQVRAPDELVVDADPSRLRQVLENLLSNAIKHCPPGVPIIMDVDTQARDDGTWARVTVRDAGPGIAADVLPRLFTRFAPGAKSKGLGLGLYLARGIVEAHGGTLTVESLPGQGAAFIVALPMRPSNT